MRTYGNRNFPQVRLCFNLTYFKEKRYLLKAFIINFAKHKRLTNKNENLEKASEQIYELENDTVYFTKNIKYSNLLSIIGGNFQTILKLN